MNPTTFEVSVAICMLGVAAALVLWVMHYMATTSAKRMRRMMIRGGLDPAIAAYGGAQPEALMKALRHRCLKCQSEDVCERWLAGKVDGDNDFCPNAEIFYALKRTAARTA